MAESENIGQRNCETVMRFRLRVRSPDEAFDRFFPDGRQVLNRTEWRGKEPRSCAITGLSGGPTAAGLESEVELNVEVTYRPKGVITFIGETRYDGWTATILDKAKDGTLLDGHGRPLQPGAKPVYLPVETYKDVDFNATDFGEFISEHEVGGIKHLTFEEAFALIKVDQKFRAGMRSAFVAARRQRPVARIVLSELDLKPAGSEFGIRTFMLNKRDPQFEQLLVERLYEVASGFIEGRYSLKSTSSGEIELVDMAGCLMELTGSNEQVKSDFHVFTKYVTPDVMEELAKRLMAVYLVDVTVVDGEKGGFVLRHVPHDD